MSIKKTKLKWAISIVVSIVMIIISYFIYSFFNTNRVIKDEKQVENLREVVDDDMVPASIPEEVVINNKLVKSESRNIISPFFDNQNDNNQNMVDKTKAYKLFMTMRKVNNSEKITDQEAVDFLQYVASIISQSMLTRDDYEDNCFWCFSKDIEKLQEVASKITKETATYWDPQDTVDFEHNKDLRKVCIGMRFLGSDKKMTMIMVGNFCEQDKLEDEFKSDSVIEPTNVISIDSPAIEPTIFDEDYIMTITDSDNDGILNIVEKEIGTNEYNKDTDGDRHEDRMEIFTGYNPKGDGTIPENITKNLRFEENGDVWFISSEPRSDDYFFLGNKNEADYEKKWTTAKEKYLEYLEKFKALSQYKIEYELTSELYETSKADIVAIKDYDTIKNRYNFNFDDEYEDNEQSSFMDLLQINDQYYICGERGKEVPTHPFEGGFTGCQQFDKNEEARIKTIADLVNLTESSKVEYVEERNTNNQKCDLFSVKYDLQNLKKYFLIWAGYDNEYHYINKEVCFSKETGLPIYINGKMIITNIMLGEDKNLFEIQAKSISTEINRDEVLPSTPFSTSIMARSDDRVIFLLTPYGYLQEKLILNVDRYQETYEIIENEKVEIADELMPGTLSKIEINTDLDKYSSFRLCYKDYCDTNRYLDQTSLKCFEYFSEEEKCNIDPICEYKNPFCHIRDCSDARKERDCLTTDYSHCKWSEVGDRYFCGNKKCEEYVDRKSCHSFGEYKCEWKDNLCGEKEY